MLKPVSGSAFMLWVVALCICRAAAAEAPASESKPAERGPIQFELLAQMRWQLDHVGGIVPLPSDNRNFFQLRRLRLRVGGELNRYLGVRVQLALQELARDDVSGEVLQDAILYIAPSRALTIQLGQYKLPISREELRSAHDLLLIDRSPIVNGSFRNALWISRDIGLMAYGRLDVHEVPISYYGGIWNGEGRNRPQDFQDSNDTKLLGGRIEVTPRSGLGLAAALLLRPIHSGAGLYRFDDASFSIPDWRDYRETERVWSLDGTLTGNWARRQLIVEGELIQGTNTRALALAMRDSLVSEVSILPRPGDQGFTQRGALISSLFLLRTSGVITGWEIAGRLSRFDPNTDRGEDETTEVAAALGWRFLDPPERKTNRLQLEFTTLSYAEIARRNDWQFKVQWQTRF